MEVHLVLKADPESRSSPIFQRSKDGNKIVFPKFQTQFNFESISYPEDNVFDKVAQPLIEKKFFKGEDSSLITLGPTNSGKSHLLFKNEKSIVDQSLRFIFKNIEPLSNDVGRIRAYYPDIFDARIPDLEGDVSCSSCQYLTVSMFELYNDNIIDLLHPNPKHLRENSTIVTDPVDTKLTPRNISKSLVNSYESVHGLVFNGLSRRKTCPTFTNSDSSRSHCFIFLNLHKIYADVMKTTRFTIVDLAGLERSKSAGTSGLSLKEASYTNGSLTELGRCFELISMKQFYKTCLRTNKLTRLVLNDYVKLNHPMCILVTLDPFGEEGLVLQTLRYIDPIKYQNLQRKSISSFTARPNLINKKEQQSLIKEIENLRQKQKLLKSKVHSLEEFVIVNENKIRGQLYEENERNLSQVLVDHKEEINQLTQSFVAQTDKKLQDQSDSFKKKNDEIQQILCNKQKELNHSSEELRNQKLELQNLKFEYKQLTGTLQELKTSNLEVVDGLRQKLEESSNTNENLRIELETLTLKMSDFEANQKEEMIRVENENSIAVANLQMELDQSKIKLLDSENTSAALREALSANEAQNDILTDIRSTLQKNVESLKMELQREEEKHENLSNKHKEELQKITETLSTRERELSNSNAKLKSLEKEFEQQEKLKNEVTTALKAEIISLEERIGIVEDEKLKIVDEMKHLEKSSNQNTSSFNQKLAERQLTIAKLEEKMTATTERYKVEVDKKDSRIKLLNAELEKANAALARDNAFFKRELQNKETEIIKLIEKNTEEMKLSELSYKTSITELEEELKKVKSLFKEETEKRITQNLDFEKTSERKNEELLALLEKSELLSESVQKLQNALHNQSSENRDIITSTKNTEEELAKLQLLCSDLKSELSEKEKFVEKYSVLRSKNAEYSEYVKKLQSENEKTSKDMEDKKAELEEYVKKIAKLKKKIVILEVKQMSVSGSRSSPEIQDALSKEVLVDKTPREALNILDTDPLDDLGLPSIMSSPLKPPSFQIHNDQLEKDNTISLGSTQHKKKKKSRKLSKQEQLFNQKQLHEKRMMESYDSSKSSKSSKFKFKALSSTNGSELNKKVFSDESSLDTKNTKKRKTLSPLKPHKKKVRRSMGGEDSLDLLE